MYTPNATLGERLQEALRDKGMRQADLIRLTGINSGALSSYITGRYAPKRETLYKLGRALDVSEMWLAGYDVPKERPAAQKENDALAGIIQRARQDEDYKTLLVKTAGLNEDQVKLLNQLVDQLTSAPKTSE